MQSELRLHPLSVGFAIVTQVRRFLIPLLIGGFSASRWGVGWQPLVGFVLLPMALSSVVRYLTYRYRFEPKELVIRSGLVFRQERHIPYARIQNLDVVQGVAHRLTGVVEIQIQTGGGSEPEAKMSVLPESAVPDLRRRVFEGRKGAPPGLPAEGAGDAILSAEPEEGTGAAAKPDAAQGDGSAGELLLHLPPGELLVYGLVQNRGMIVIAAGLGVAWELGVMERLAAAVFGNGSWARGVLDDVTGSAFGGELALGAIALALAGIVAILLIARVLSIAWAWVRLHDFTIRRVGEDLQTRFGLLTRVSATIPIRRIQKLTIHEGPLHRLAGRVALRVDTAGASRFDQGDEAHRQWLAPILRRERLARFVREVLPELDLDAVVWEPVSPGAFRRVLKESAAVATLVSIPFIFVIGRGGLIVLAGALVWAGLYARRYVDALGWAVRPGAVLYRSGWLWRRTSVARFAKIQIVSLKASPFDRRREMARVAVDTAGAGSGSHALEIPYLPVLRARELTDALAGAAARIEFTW